MHTKHQLNLQPTKRRQRRGTAGRSGAGRGGAANNNGSKSTVLRFARELIKRSSHVWARSHGLATLGYVRSPTLAAMNPSFTSH